jgi:hypothetical protein
VRPVLVVLAGFTVLAALLAWSRWLAGRRWATAGHVLLALALGAIVGTGWPFARHLEAYEVRVPELPVAEVFFERLSPGRYRVALTRLPSGRMQVVELAGDDWRMDLRTLDWSEPAARLGSRPRYRIEALASRPAPAATTGLPLGITADLTAADESTPWLAGLGGHWGRPLVALREVSGAWQPMVDGARFGVRLTAAGALEVEPRNAAASDGLATR